MSSLSPLTLVPERQLRIELHKAQTDFCESRALFRGFVGGRGSGKSYAGALDMLLRASSADCRTFMVASPTGVLMQDTTFPTFKAIARKLGIPLSIKVAPYPNVTLPSGSVVRFRTADDPERLRGPNLSGVWLDEASLMEREAYDITIACLRERERQGWLTATFTPKGFGHWTYEVFGGKMPNTAIFNSDTRENPFNPEGFRDTLAAQYGPMLRRQELGGEFVSVEGAEWPSECFEHGAFWFDRWPDANWACKTIAIDPSKGKDAKDGDYSAIVKLGVTWEGQEYAEADLQRRPIDTICYDAAQAVKDFEPDGLYLEPAMFQDLMAPDLRKAMRNLDVETTIHLEPDTAPKPVRIRRLTECIMQKTISFRRNHRGTELLVQQLRDFGPKNDKAHDDGPDALEMARRLAIRLIRGKKEKHKR